MSVREQQAALADVRGVVEQFRANPRESYPQTLVELLLEATERLIDTIDEVSA